MLDKFLPSPRLVEFDYVYVGVSPTAAYAAVRHFDGARSPLIRALFNRRTQPDGDLSQSRSLHLDDLDSRPTPGLRILMDQPGVGFVIGAIGRFWEFPIPFAAVAPESFAEFAAPGWGKVAWAVHFEKWGQDGTRILFELRHDVTSADVGDKQQRCFRLIGPFSHLLRHHILCLLDRELGVFDSDEQRSLLPGDEFIALPKAQADHTITIAAAPEQIWPWLVHLACRRGDDLRDDVPSNGKRRLELQNVAVGDVFTGSSAGQNDFTVLQVAPTRVLVLGSTFDLDAAHAVLASAALPSFYWRATWAFVLQPLDAGHTRLQVRGRVDFDADSGSFRALWMGPIHHFMQSEQLRHLKRRAEGQLQPAQETTRDIGTGIVAALGMVATMATPFLRQRRSHWGISQALAQRSYPGDELVAVPKWAWTHGVEIDAPTAAVWPWVVQIGQDKAGFYSYQWLENLAGCNLQNAERIHPEWQQLHAGDKFKIYGGSAQALTVTQVAPGQWFVVHGEMDPVTGGPPSLVEPERYVRVSWLFFIESLGPERCRLISRYRIDYCQDGVTRMTFGPLLAEPIGFVMDRRMLLGVKERAERAHSTKNAGDNRFARVEQDDLLRLLTFNEP